MVFEKEKEALKLAMQNEIDSKKLYIESKEKTKSDSIKKIFEYLAEQEQIHFEKLQKVESLLSKEAIEELNIDINFHLDESKKLFSEKIAVLKKEIDKAKESEELNVFEVAIEIERKGYHFYKQIANETEMIKLKNFFILKR